MLLLLNGLSGPEEVTVATKLRSVLATDFSQHANSSMAQHLPHLGHGSEIGIEFALPVAVVSSTLRASLGGAGVAGPSFSRSDAAGAS